MVLIAALVALYGSLSVSATPLFPSAGNPYDSVLGPYEVINEDDVGHTANMAVHEEVPHKDLLVDVSEQDGESSVKVECIKEGGFSTWGSAKTQPVANTLSLLDLNKKVKQKMSCSGVSSCVKSYGFSPSLTTALAVIAIVIVLALLLLVYWYTSSPEACDDVCGMKVDPGIHGSSEMITNRLLLATFRILVLRPKTSSVITISLIIGSFLLSRLYVPLKNEPLDLGPFETRLKAVHGHLENDFQSNLREKTYGTMLIWMHHDNANKKSKDRKDNDDDDNNGENGEVENFARNQQVRDMLDRLEKKLDDLKDNKTAGCRGHSLDWQTLPRDWNENMEHPLLAKNGRGMIVQLSLKVISAFGQRIPCFASLRDTAASLNGQLGGLNVTMVSENAVVDASLEKCESESYAHMAVSAPIMIGLLMLGVGTLPRAITPFLCLAASILGMRASLVLIKFGYNDLNFSGPDTANMFVMLALCFDYALFFWARFAGERRKNPGQDMVQRCVMTTLMTSGYVIMLSCLVLVLTFIVGSFYPDHNNLGYLGGSLQFITGITFCGFYSLTIPALLALLFPSLFDEPTEDGPTKWFSDVVKRHITVRPWWIKRLGEAITRPPWVLLMPLLIFLALVPLLFISANPSYDNFHAYASHEVPEYDAYNFYADQFKMGQLNPAIVMLEALPVHGHTQTEEDVTLKPEFAKATCRFVNKMIEETKGTDFEIKDTDVEGLYWNSMSGDCLSDPNDSLKKTMLSVDGQQQILKVFVKPDGETAEAMTKRFWDTIEPEGAWTFALGRLQYNFKASLITPTAEEMLVEQNYQERFPLIMLITVVLVCCLVGYCFSSVFLSLKLVFTVIIPICAEYGLLFGIYQNGWLSFLGIEKTPGIPWTILYSTAGLLFALAMDYDMFLFARVYERRLEGYDNRSAVRIALEETGPPISLAGSLMVVAFFFIFLSSVPIVSQTGLLYCLGVAVDTYIIRMWIAPASLCMFENMNYWPGKMPEPTKDYEHYDQMNNEIENK